MTKITIERETLLPCPFCGDDGDKGRQEVTQMIEGRNKFARITCLSCGAMCPEENWNRRAALAAQPAGQKQCWVCGGAGVEWSDTNEQSPCSNPDCVDGAIPPPAPAAVPLTDDQLRADLISCRGTVKADRNHYERLAEVHRGRITAAAYEAEASRLDALLERIDALIAVDKTKEQTP